MTNHDWQRIRDLFEQALDVESSQLLEWVAVTCAGDTPEVRDELRRLLQIDSRMTGSELVLGGDVVGGPRGRELRPGEEFEGFRIVRELGRGGMGTVYEAEQKSPLRRVALKALHPYRCSERARQRFEYEADLLARLQHPGIARVYAAGTHLADGVEIPWFALELIENSESCTRFLRRTQASLEEKLALFVRIAAAVHHGHQRGVIHRDLKPENVLVDDRARPVVIDFGIARSLSDDGRHTREGQLVGTPLYMSPEQLRDDLGPVDSQSDIYALGVLLHEILVGVTPFELPGDQSLTAVVRAILETTPELPSRLCPDLPVELDWVVSTAMAQDRRERYASASELAQDVQRFLDHQPLVAGSPTFAYRFRKLVRRHRLATTLASLLLVSLIASTIVSTVLLVRARTAEALAAHRLEDLSGQIEARSEAASSVRELISALGQSARSDDSRVIAVLDEAAAGAAETFADRPLHYASLLLELGRTYRTLGLIERAMPHLERAAQVSAGLPSAENLRLSCREELIDTLVETGDVESAEAMLRELLSTREAQREEDPGGYARVLSRQGRLLLQLGQAAKARPVFEQAYRLLSELEGPGSRDALGALSGTVEAARLTKSPDARAIAERALALTREHFGAKTPKLVTALNNLATVLVDLEDLETATPLIVEQISLSEELFGPTSDRVRRAAQNLGALFFKQGKLGEAERWMRRALEIEQQPTPQTVVGWINIVVLLCKLERFEDAIAADDSALALLAKLQQGGFPKKHWLPAVVGQVRGRALRGAKRYDEAEAALLESLTLMRDTSPQRVPKVEAELVSLYDAWQKPKKADRYRPDKEK